MVAEMPRLALPSKYRYCKYITEPGRTTGKEINEMTKYETLMKKADDCLRAATQCSPRFIKLWLKKDRELREMALDMSVEEAGRVIRT